MNANELYWLTERRKQLKEKYLDFLKNKNLENTFDNCNDFLSLSMGTNIPKKEYGVSSRVELAKLISGQERNLYSI